MTYQPHYLLAWGGTMSNGKEIWSNSVRVKGVLAGEVWTDDFIYSVLDGYIADIRALVNDVAAGMHHTVKLTWAKFNPINELGHYASTTKTYARYLSATEGASGGIGANVPTYQTCAVTLKTAVQRGPGSAGRFFIPRCAYAVDDDGFYTPTIAQAAATRYASFIRDLGNMPGIDVNTIIPHVISNVGNPGPANPVTLVQIGSVPDVMRSRKSALLEARSSAVVPT
jgi:hypothetical protein